MIWHQVRIIVHRASANTITLTFLSALKRCEAAIPLDLLESVQLLASVFFWAMFDFEARIFLVKSDTSDLRS